METRDRPIAAIHLSVEMLRLQLAFRPFVVPLALTAPIAIAKA
jgi:hypothetical protein